MKLALLKLAAMFNRLLGYDESQPVTVVQRFGFIRTTETGRFSREAYDRRELPALYFTRDHSINGPSSATICRS